MRRGGRLVLNGPGKWCSRCVLVVILECHGPVHAGHVEEALTVSVEAMESTRKKEKFLEASRY